MKRWTRTDKILAWTAVFVLFGALGAWTGKIQIDINHLDQKIDQLEAERAVIQELEARMAQIQTLEAQTGRFGDIQTDCPEGSQVTLGTFGIRCVPPQE